MKRVLTAAIICALAAPLAAQKTSTLEWGGLERYREDNARLPAPGAEARVVFMGNSITEAWARLFPNLFPRKPYIGRGIGGQTTAQMLVRFRQDVIALKPTVVVILAGTNDVAGNTGPSSVEMIQDNLASMAELARANGIRVVLCSVLPVYDYPWKKGLEPAPKIMAINDWMKRYAAAHDAVYVDLHSAMEDERHGMRADLAYDGVHPTEAGFRVMAPLVERGIAQAQSGSWVQLFNGRDLADWQIKFKGRPLGENLNNTFRVEDGLLKVRYDRWTGFNGEFGHIFYKQPFSHYVVAAEYRFVGEQVPGATQALSWALRNNGIMVHSQSPESMGLDQDFPMSLEVQLLGGLGRGPRPTGNLCTPGLNVHFGDSLVTRHCINSTSKTYDGDQWVRAEALVLGDSVIKHIVNGDTVLVYRKPVMGGGNANDMKPGVSVDGTPVRSGYIALQAETAPIDFRKVEIRDLSATSNLQPRSRRPSLNGESLMRMAIDTKGVGAPLVLVGGGLTGWQSWIPHQERLAPTRRASRAQPLTVELGLDNMPLPLEYSVKLESRGLAGALDHAGIAGAVDVAAWSYGAVVALDFALDHPERIRTLTLIEPPAFWVLEALGRLDERSRRERDALKALHDEMRDSVSEDQLERFLRQAGFAAPGTSIRAMPQWPNWVKHRRSLLQGPALFAHRDDASRLKAFQRPVLLFKGAGSAHVFHQIVDALAATIPNARAVELPGGHAPQLVAMDDFLRILQEFQASR